MNLGVAEPEQRRSGVSGEGRFRLSSKARADLTAQIAGTMRLFMAHAVLYQDAVARWAGMNSTDLQCANLLLLHGPMTPGELAGRSGLTAGGAITAVVDRLEKAGMARRDRDPVDRRRVVITPDAAALWARVGPVYTRVDARWNEYLATLDHEQLASANELFARASELNREEIDWLRNAPRPHADEPTTDR